MSEQITMDDMNGFSEGDVAETGSDATETGTKDAPEESGDDSTSSEEDAKESADADSSKEGEGDDDEEADDDEEGKEDATLEYKEDDFTIPEGMELDSEMMGEAVSLFKEMKLPKDQAQKLVSLYAEKQQGALDRQLEQWEETRTGWKEEAKADKEFGGKKYEENKAVMLRALNAFGSKDLAMFGNQYGWADHPAYQRFLYKAGLSVSEDKAKGGKPKAEQKSIEERWYETPDK